MSGGESKTAAGDPEVVSVSLSLSECPVSAVTVFLDRAEVTREVSFTPEAAGAHDVVVQGTSGHLDRDSLRVKGTGQCEILEVSYETRYVSNADEAEKSQGAARIKELDDQIQELQTQLNAQGKALARFRRRQALLNTFTDAMVAGTRGGGSESKDGDTTAEGAPPAAALGAGNLEYVSNLLEFNETQSEELDEKEAAKVREIEDTRAEIARVAALRAEVDGKCREGDSRHPRHDVTISVQVKAAEGDSIDLKLTYVVSNASWTPSYDIRVDSTDNTLAVTYFGNVQQRTGEDWRNCTVSLSTATPNVGGTPPELPQQAVRWYTPPVVRIHATKKSKGMRRRSRMREEAERLDDDDEAEEESLCDVDEAKAVEEDLSAAVVTTSVKSSGSGSATFTVPRDATIDCDNKPHKLTVACVELQPEFILYAAPAYSPHAFLQAKTTNTSDFPFLPSPKAAVYFDGNFVTTTSMAQVNPGEVFQSFLGVDPTVKVDFRPVRERQRTEGVFARSRSKQIERCTVLTNTKATPVRVVIADVFPRSTDEKIQVQLLEPVPESLVTPRQGVSAAAGSGEAGAIDELLRAAGAGQRARDVAMRNNSTNNLLWLRHVGPGETTQVPFVYSITCPEDKAVEVV